MFDVIKEILISENFLKVIMKDLKKALVYIKTICYIPIAICI